MKKNGILCILIAAALLVTSLAAVSADQSAWITQQALQDNNNAISGTMPNIAINSSNNQVIDSFNHQGQFAVAVQTGGIVAAGGDIRDTDITKCGECGVGNQTALIGQVAIQSNNNTIDASPADVGDITIDVIGMGILDVGPFYYEGWTEEDELHMVVPIPNVAVNSPNNQAIISRNTQEQFAATVQTGEIVGAVGDIRDCNVYNGPIVADGNGNGNNDGPPKPPTGPGPAARP